MNEYKKMALIIGFILVLMGIADANNYADRQASAHLHVAEVGR